MQDALYELRVDSREPEGASIKNELELAYTCLKKPVVKTSAVL